MIDKLLDIKNILINEYKVNGLSIYGSFSRNEQTIYSDIDLLINVDDYLSYDIDTLKEYLSNYLNRPIDINIYNICKLDIVDLVKVY